MASMESKEILDFQVIVKRKSIISISNNTPILTGPPGPTAGGATYIRWGRTTCNSTAGTQLLYSGRAAGSFYNEQGGGANYLCLPDDPDFLSYTSGAQNYRAHLYGTEYQAVNTPPAFGSMTNHNVPCAVCYTPTRGTMIMIPAKTTCPTSWTREYYGYIMSAYHGFQRTMYECVDSDAESVPGSSTFVGGALFHFVESRCTGIPCPPYADGKELACIVCTK